MIPRKPSSNQNGVRQMPPIETKSIRTNAPTLPAIDGAASARGPKRTHSTVSEREPNTAREHIPTQSLSAPGAMTPEEMLNRYEVALTPYEREEIKTFPVVYFCAPNAYNSKIQAPSPKVRQGVNAGPNFGFDDDRGDYNVVMRDHFAYRYEVLSMLGKGSFGQVVKVLDHKNNVQMALKIIRNKKRFHQQAQVEIKVLEHLRHRDPDGKYGIVKMYETFTFRNHICLAYELLAMNLYEYMKLNRFCPMPLHAVKKIGASLLISLAFMWREHIIHCDLKPENILLRQPNRTAVKVIDLGSSCFETEKIYSYIQSRFYRAPEIILGIPYTRRIDSWSYACVLIELATGFPLFPGENETEQLACIMEFMGVPPASLLDAAPRRKTFFDLSPTGYVPKLVPNSRKVVRMPGTRTLSALLGKDADDPFVLFLELFLQWNPEDRALPEPAMRHPWICDAFVGLKAQQSTDPAKYNSFVAPKPPTGPHKPSGGAYVRGVGQEGTRQPTQNRQSSSGSHGGSQGGSRGGSHGGDEAPAAAAPQPAPSTATVTLPNIFGNAKRGTM